MTANKPITVLHVVGGVDRGGGVMHVATELAREGIDGEKTFVWKHRDFKPDISAELFVCGGVARHSDRGALSDLIGALCDVMPLVKWIRCHDRVLLHAHSRMGTIAAAIASKLTGCAMIIHLHGLWKRKWIYRALIRSTRAKVIFNSTKTCRHFGFDPANSIVLMPHINWPVKPAVEGGPERFIAASAFVPVKNLEAILGAFEQFEKARDVRLVLFGLSDDPLDHQYQDEIVSRCRNNSRIEIRPYNPNWTSELTQNDVFVHAAELESFGIVILEAFARGCRCVVPSGLFLDDLEEPFRSTGVYRAMPVTALHLLQRMKEAMNATKSAEELWRLRRAVADEFSIKKAASKLSTVYESVIH